MNKFLAEKFEIDAFLDSPFSESSSGTNTAMGHDGTIKFWNITTGECLQTLINNDSVESLGVLPDGSIVSGCEDVKIWYPRMLIEPTLKDTLCMTILMLKNLVVEHYLDATTIIELYQMM